MQQVDIFLYISSKAPRINGASYIYVLTCGKKYISGKGEVKEITTRNRSTLICATEALKRMNKPALITIHTNNQYIVDNHMRLDSWEKKGWTNSRGQPLKNADLWKQLYDLQKMHSVRYVYDEKVDNIS